MLSWVVAAGCGAERWRSVYAWTLGVVAIGSFSAALGMRASLSSPTATRASSITIAGWVGAMFGVPIVAGIVMAICIAVLMTILFFSQWVGRAFGDNNTPNAVRSLLQFIDWVWPTLTNGIFIGLALAVLADTRLRFDWLAGRMAGDGAGGLLSRLFNSPKRLSKRKKRALTATPETALSPASTASSASTATTTSTASTASIATTEPIPAAPPAEPAPAPANEVGVGR